MTGLDGRRVYLDWNATAPLRPEAREAMLAAMDAVGNPSSVHAEGRAARAIVETARGRVARLVGCDREAVVFTSGATEAVALACRQSARMAASAVEHDAVAALADEVLPVDRAGRVVGAGSCGLVAIQTANSETGVLQDSDAWQGRARLLSDATQTVGKLISPLRVGASFSVASAHKFGGPKGIGALVARGVDVVSAGGGQEQGRRSGTENVIGIAGFGAAAEAALRDIEAGVWDRVEKIREILEHRLAAVAQETIFFGQESPRLPNTSCFAVPGWAGETQVMGLDLAGFAVSAGSACSSGKVNRASRVLMAMGYDETVASSAIRVSLGPTTTEAEVMAFADTWEQLYRRRQGRAA